MHEHRVRAGFLSRTDERVSVQAAGDEEQRTRGEAGRRPSCGRFRKHFGTVPPARGGSVCQTVPSCFPNRVPFTAGDHPGVEPRCRRAGKPGRAFHPGSDSRLRKQNGTPEPPARPPPRGTVPSGFGFDTRETSTRTPATCRGLQTSWESLPVSHPRFWKQGHLLPAHLGFRDAEPALLRLQPAPARSEARLLRARAPVRHRSGVPMSRRAEDRVHRPGPWPHRGS